MRILISLFTLIFLASSLPSFGIPIKRQFRDMKLVTQKLIEHQTITDPAAAGTTDILSADAGIIAAAPVTITTFVTDPDLTRSLQFTIGGTAADIGSCTATVTGTDFHGQTITENFTATLNTAETLQGAKAFSTMTSIALPAACEDSPYGATWSVGFGEKLGLKRCLDQAGHVVMSTVAGAFESTRPTIANDTANIEGNTADFNGTMDGSNDFEIFFFQNYAQSCFP